MRIKNRKSKKSDPLRRAPFDPARALGAEQGSLFAPAESPAPAPPESPIASQPKIETQKPKSDPTTLSVSQLNQLIKGAIKAVLPGTYHVIGELSNLSRSSSPGASGHVYFTLKDRTGEIRCVMWNSSAVRLKFKLEDGLEVIATGEVDVFEQRGQYQLYVKAIEPRGAGALDLAFRQLREKLQREGLFDAAHKKPLPKFPRRIAIVTSPTGAAIRDILTTIKRRYSACEVLVFGVRVQGEGAAAEIADTIRRINVESARLGGIDCLIVGRGGGSIEDLWAFNEEIVARAIYDSRIPIVSAVGHEVDFTIADFVADIRAATPTAAAELVVPLLGELILYLDDAAQRLSRAGHRLIERAGARLALVERYDWFSDPVSRIRHRQQEIDEVAGRLNLAQAKYLQARRGRLHDGEIRLARVRPEAVLARRRELLMSMEHRLQWAGRKRLAGMDQRLRDLAMRATKVSPAGTLQRSVLLSEQLSRRLQFAVQRVMDRHLEGVNGMEKRLAAGSHEAILRRGFSITRREADGRIVLRPTDAAQGDALQTITSEGQIRSVVAEDQKS